MKDDHQLVIIATYDDLDAARSDFVNLEGRLKHGMEVRAGALVTKDDHGQASVSELANRHGRMGTLMGAGIGLLAGLVIQPVLLGVLAGGAGGALAAAIAEHELRSGVRKDVGDALQNGTAVVIALVYPNGRGHVETALTRAKSFAEVRMDTATMQDIDDAVAAEVAKVQAGASSDTTDTRS